MPPGVLRHLPLCLIVIAVSTAQTARASCPAGWLKSEQSGTCIKVYDELKTWEQARATCKKDGADLVKIVNKTMNNFIFEEIASHPNENEFWIGLNDRETEGTFLWRDETEIQEYENWDYKQPSNTNSMKDEDCAKMLGSWFDAGKWHDEPCNKLHAFICERPHEAPAAGSCPTGWTESPHTGTCIKLYDEEKSWHGARVACKEEAADLVKIKDDGMNQFIWDQVSRENGVFYWIGLHDLRGEGRYQWLDESEEAEGVPWGENQPNDKGSYGGQDCAGIGSTIVGPGLWNDEACTVRAKFICEKSPRGSSTTASKPSCPTGWTESPHTGTCIKLYDEEKSWHGARVACKEEAADLVIIKDDGMNQFIWDQVSRENGVFYWIGLHDLRGEGRYQWLDESEEAEDVPWGENQPNDKGSYGGQDCAGIGSTIVGPGLWNDEACTVRAKFICEKSPSGSSTTASKPECPTGWRASEYSGTCIKVHDEVKTWEDARATCQADDADLVKIVNQEMNEFLWEETKSHPTQFEFWIGLHDKGTEGTFLWLDETEELKYKHWDLNQPSHTGSTKDEDCAKMMSSSFDFGMWHDAVCNSLHSFICERPLAQCPTGWVDSKFSKTCIRLYDEDKTWKSARATCKEDGADLVKIVNADMDEFIFEQVKSHASFEFWIGFHDLETEGTFLWLDETEAPEYDNWATKQPSHTGSTEEQDCAKIMSSVFDLGKWNDEDCTHPHTFICERPYGAATADKQTGDDATGQVDTEDDATGHPEQVDTEDDRTGESPATVPDSKRQDQIPNNAQGREGLGGGAIAAIVILTLVCAAAVCAVFFGRRYYLARRAEKYSVAVAYTNSLYSQMNETESNSKR